MKSISSEQFMTRFQFKAGAGPLILDEEIIVYNAVDKELHREVAIKIIRDDSPNRRYPSLKEMAKLFQLDHGHLVSYFDFLRVEKTEKSNGFDVLVMDYVSGGDFDELKSRMISDKTRERVVEGILGALGVLHSNGIIHGNLKPGNILFQDIGHLHARLSDYGFVQIQKYETVGDQFDVSRIKYLAPEQISPKVYARRGRIWENVAFWPLGMLVYELFKGKDTFGEATNASDLMTRTLHSDLPEDLEDLPDNYDELVKACLVRKAVDRPKSVETLRKILGGKIT